MSESTKSLNDILGREPVHPFPARMAPGIALSVLRARNRPLRVLDPMMGSGTVVAVARSEGHRAFGVDIDPLAVLMSRVWTSAIDGDEVMGKAAEVLRRARDRFDGIADTDAYPSRADDETRAFIRYWFDPYARKQLAALSRGISRVWDH